MDDQEAAFFAQLLTTFKVEAEEHLQELSSGLVIMEANKEAPQPADLIEKLFREAHSLKGAARAVNLLPIQAICQSFENVMAGIKKGQITLSGELFETLYATIDALTAYVHACDNEELQKDLPAISQLTDRLEKLALPEEKMEKRQAAASIVPPSVSAIAPQSAVSVSSTEAVISESKPAEFSIEAPEKINVPLPADEAVKTKTIRIQTQKLDQLLQESEEMLIVKLTAGQRLSELKMLHASILDESHKVLQRQLEADHYLNVHLEARQHSVKTQLYSLFEQYRQSSKEIEAQVSQLIKEASRDERVFSSMVENLLEDIKKVLMQPFSTLFDTLPRMVRDLAASLNKEIEIHFDGGDVEVDRRILEEMKDPLIHLIRNCIDHGIELPQLREQARKPRKARIKVAASKASGNWVEVEVSDDGGGIDTEKVKQSALKLGVVKPEDARSLSEEDAALLIFHSGVSTSPIITEVSGRGLGMGIVAEKVEKLGGKVRLESKRKIGTICRLLLPLTLATFRGVYVKVAGAFFIIPALHVTCVFRMAPDGIKNIENLPVVHLNGQTFPAVYLKEVLGLSGEPSVNHWMQFVLIQALNTSVAFAVDSVQSEQEVFVKPLGNQLKHVTNISAATVTEEGSVIPILDPFDLIRSVMKGAAVFPGMIKAQVEKRARSIILVVEDSVTARMLLKNILESAGYEVKTAFDGLEALSLLGVEKIDLMISDIEMPRMDGLDLTKKVREDQKWKDLPIILCTSRGSKEDLERGIAAGANAYIDKSSFVQSHLLDIIKKLL